MIGAAAVAAAAVVLAGAPTWMTVPGEAHVPTTYRAAVQQGLDGGARTFWHGQRPACGQPVVVVDKLPEHDEGGYAEPSRCTVTLAPWVLDGSLAPSYVCALALHEYGHLIGRAHTRRGLMAPDVRLSPRVCASTIVGRRRP